jgi:hypothetical protein
MGKDDSVGLSSGWGTMTLGFAPKQGDLLRLDPQSCGSPKQRRLNTRTRRLGAAEPKWVSRLLRGPPGRVSVSAGEISRLSNAVPHLHGAAMDVGDHGDAAAFDADRRCSPCDRLSQGVGAVSSRGDESRE